MYNGGSSDSPINSNRDCIIKVIENKIDKSKNDEEKRISESALHYFNAFIGYNAYYYHIDNTGYRAMSYVIEYGGITERLKSDLKYVLEELNKAKNCLDLKDETNLNFINECISFIKKDEVDRINSILKSNERDRRREQGLCTECGNGLGFFDKLFGRTKCSKHRKKNKNEIIEEKRIFNSAIGFIVGGLFGYLLNNESITHFIHILIYILITIFIIHMAFEQLDSGYLLDFLGSVVGCSVIVIIILAIIFWVLGAIGLDSFVSMGLFFSLTLYYYSKTKLED
jgi:hypothetical protein